MGLAGATLLIVLAAAQPGANEAKTRAIAVLQLEAQGVETKVTTIVTDTMLSQLNRLPNTRVIGQREIETMLKYEKLKMQVGCTDLSCMVEIGGALGVDKLVTGSLGKLGESFVMNVKLIDIRNAGIEQTFTRRLKGGTDEDFLDALPDALTTLFPKGEPIWRSFARGTKYPADLSMWGHVTFWTGLAAAGTGGIFTALASGASEDFKASGLDSDKDRINSHNAVAVSMYVLGGALMATGITLWVLSPDQPATAGKPLTFVPTFDPRGGSLNVGGAW
jgi:TolB-like protein